MCAVVLIAKGGAVQTNDESVGKYLDRIYNPKTGKVRLWVRFRWSLRDNFNRTTLMVLGAILGTFAGTLFLTGALGYSPDWSVIIAFLATMAVVCGIAGGVATYRRTQDAKHQRRRRVPLPKDHKGSLDDYDVDVRPKKKNPD